MISGQLGTAQLGLAQLGDFTTSMSSGSSPAPSSVGVIDSNALNILTIPNYFELMGQWPLED